MPEYKWTNIAFGGKEGPHCGDRFRLDRDGTDLYVVRWNDDGDAECSFSLDGDVAITVNPAHMIRVWVAQPVASAKRVEDFRLGARFILDGNRWERVPGGVRLLSASGMQIKPEVKLTSVSAEGKAFFDRIVLPEHVITE